MPEGRHAFFYRMVLPDHTCRFSLRAKGLLQDRGQEVEGDVLGTREEADVFQAEHDVRTRPRVFIGGERIGGSDELANLLASA